MAKFTRLEIHTNEYFAIKSVKISSLQKFNLENTVHNEVKTLQNIHNPHIVSLYGLKQTATHYFFIYEYCNGGTLESYISHSKGPLPEKEILMIFKQMLLAFQEMRSKKIVHRDIKPSNILFHNNIIKIADFGFCKVLENEIDLMETMVGSPLYMAPEILKGKPYGPNADIWSFGVVIYQLFYGKVPFEEKSLPLLIQRLEKEDIPFPKKEGVMREVLQRMLIKDDKKRINWESLFMFLGNKQENREKNVIHAFHLLCFERSKIQYLYEVFDVMLSLKLYEKKWFYYLFMKRIYCHAKKIQYNLFENFNPENISNLSIDKNVYDHLIKSENYKKLSLIMKEEFKRIEKNYFQFYEFFKTNKEDNYHLNNEFMNHEKVEKIFYEKEILNYCSSLKNMAEIDSNKTYEILVHLNQVLESVNLDDFFKNYFEVGKNLKDQKYFTILKAYDAHILKNLIINKLDLFTSKILKKL